MSNTSQKEDEFFRQFAEGTDSFLYSLLLEYHSRIYSFAFYLTRSDLFSEEIIHEIYLRARRERETLSNPEFSEAWLKTIARNVGIDQLQKFASESMILDQLSHPTEAVQDSNTPLYNSFEKALEETFNALPPRQRLAYLLSRQHALFYDEVAEEMGISKFTVGDYLKHTRASFRKTIDGHILHLVNDALFESWK